MWRRRRRLLRRGRQAADGTAAATERTRIEEEGEAFLCFLVRAVRFLDPRRGSPEASPAGAGMPGEAEADEALTNCRWFSLRDLSAPVVGFWEHFWERRRGRANWDSGDSSGEFLGPFGIYLPLRPVMDSGKRTNFT
jgi:hypothetical protein